MEMTKPTIVKVIKCKSALFEHTVGISKRPKGSVYIGSIIYYLTCLLAPFPKGLEVDLEGSSTFSTLMLLMYINRLSLCYHL